MLTLSKSKNGVLIEGFPSQAEMQAFFNANSYNLYLDYSGDGSGSISKRCASDGTCSSAYYRRPDQYSMSDTVYGGTSNSSLNFLWTTISLGPQQIKDMADGFDLIIGIKVNLRKTILDAVMDMGFSKNCSAFFTGFGVHEFGEAPPTIGSMGIWNLTPWDSYDLESWNYGRIYDEATMLGHVSAMGSTLKTETLPAKCLRWLGVTSYDGVYRYSDPSNYKYMTGCYEVVPNFYEDPFFDGSIHYPGLPINYSIGNIPIINFKTGEITDGFENFLRLHSLDSLISMDRWPTIEVGIPSGYDPMSGSSLMGPTIESIELIFQEDVAPLFWTGNKNCIEVI